MTRHAHKILAGSRPPRCACGATYYPVYPRGGRWRPPPPRLIEFQKVLKSMGFLYGDDAAENAMVGYDIAMKLVDEAFPIGTIIRYGEGPTALMRVGTISYNHGGPGVTRYYGQQCTGGVTGAYHGDCRAASRKDIRTWRDNRGLPCIDCGIQNDIGDLCSGCAARRAHLWAEAQKPESR